MARVRTPSGAYVVSLEGLGTRPLFVDDEDRRVFCRRLATVLPECDARCIAWCLLSDSVDLVLSTSEVTIDFVMRRIPGPYAQRYNRRHGGFGPLFHGRYASTLVEQGLPVREVICDVHLGPVLWGLVPGVEALDSYRWCGHGELFATGDADVVDRDAARACVGRGRRAREAHEALMRTRLEPARRAVRRTRAVAPSSGARPRTGAASWMALPPVLGSATFVAWARQSAAPAPRPDLDADQLIKATCARLAVAEEEVRAGRRTADASIARAVIAYIGTTSLGLSTRAVAREVGVSGPAVVQAVSRGRVLSHRLRFTLADVLASCPARRSSSARRA